MLKLQATQLSSFFLPYYTCITTLTPVIKECHVVTIERIELRPAITLDVLKKATFQSYFSTSP